MRTSCLPMLSVTARGGRWTVELICPTSDQDWVDDAPICQAGEHRGMPTASWAKHSTCPVCGGEVYGT